MADRLPINLDDLLHQRRVEGERIEYKAGWNPDAIIRTLCAFANDFENLGGGYVVIGQDCDANSQPQFPPVGLAEDQLDTIQQQLLAACQLIQPPYFPALSIERVAGRALIILQASGGMNRPYKAPASATAKHKTWHYYICRYRNRRIGEFLKELDLTEGRSTGVPKILRAMAANGSPIPQFETDDDRLTCVVRLPVHPLAEVPVAEVAQQITPEVTPEVFGMLAVMQGDMSRAEIMAALGLKDEKHFREHYQQAGIASGVIAMTLPDKPRSSKQRYQLTALGERCLQAQRERERK